MGKIQECPDLISETMMYSSEDVVTNEIKMNRIFETMLIFLDIDDLYEIGTKRVIPNLYEPTYEEWKNGRIL